ncbi:1766_t:CDS:2 [Entrophospora sp. SA101]|nr:1766_t:CDS:2 [Entrophospora sp. SA101]
MAAPFSHNPVFQYTNQRNELTNDDQTQPEEHSRTNTNTTDLFDRASHFPEFPPGYNPATTNNDQIPENPPFQQHTNLMSLINYQQQPVVREIQPAIIREDYPFFREGQNVVTEDFSVPRETQRAIREGRRILRAENRAIREGILLNNGENVNINNVTSTTSSSNLQPNSQSVEDKRCWICYGEENDSVGKWVKPCKCSLICHEECLLNWINEKQRSAALRKMSTIAYAMVTMLGLEDGQRFLEEPWNWRTYISLPLIPMLLIFSRARIADPVMPLIPMFLVRMDHLRMTIPPNPSLTISLLPWIRIIYNWTYQQLFGMMEINWRRQLEPYVVLTDNVNETGGEIGNGNNIQRRNDQDMLDRLDRNYAGRKIVGALCLPFISAIVGGLLGKFSFIRSRIPDAFHRNILGGCLFIVLKDIVSLTYKYQRATHRRSRHIRNYTEFANEDNSR